MNAGYVSVPLQGRVRRTPEGRATVQLLSMNRPLAIEIRREEALKAKYLTPR
jgi:hypothetical protein